MRFLLVLLLAITSVGVSVAQEQEQVPKPSTKLEAFQARTGVVIVRGFTTVGTIRGLGGNVTVDAREFRDAGHPNVRVTGISVTVKETTRLERENTSFIDADEIESLLEGLDYISKASKDVTTLKNFEVEYRTKGNFSLVVFNDSSGQLSVAVSSGRIGKTTAYLKLAELSVLRNLFVTAKSKL